LVKKKTDKLKVVELMKIQRNTGQGVQVVVGFMARRRIMGLEYGLLVQVQLLRTGLWTIFLFSFPFPFYGLKLG
jgi:hypothetical protein